VLTPACQTRPRALGRWNVSQVLKFRRIFIPGKNAQINLLIWRPGNILEAKLKTKTNQLIHSWSATLAGGALRGVESYRI